MDAATFLARNVGRSIGSCGWPRCTEVLIPPLSDLAPGRHKYCSDEHRSKAHTRRRTLKSALRLIDAELARERKRSLPVNQLRQRRRAVEWELSRYE